MSPFRRPPGSAGGLLRLRGAVPALLIAAAGMALPSAHATQAQTKPRTVKAAKAATASSLASSSASFSSSSSASSSANEAAPNQAKTELADIADLRKRMAAKTVVVTRHAEVADIAIQVWARTTLPRKYYAAVTQQGTLRRTLSFNDEAEAWRSYDSFRRMAGLGEVGRPVLLGQQMPVTVGAPDPDLIARAPLPRSDTPMAAREISATSGESVEPRVAGSAVETLRRTRFGDEVARLVWNAESSQYLVSLTRQGSVVAMLRSRDAAEATRAYEDYARQAETRASLLPGRSAAPVSAAAR